MKTLHLTVEVSEAFFKKHSIDMFQEVKENIPKGYKLKKVLSHEIVNNRYTGDSLVWTDSKEG